MKKILSALVLLSFLAVLIVPMVASAQEVAAPECCKLKRAFTDIDAKCVKGKWVGPTGGYCPKESGGVVATANATDNWGMCCLFNTIYTVVDWIFAALIAMAVILVLMGALQIFMAAGAPEKVASGRNYIIYALLGIGVAFLAKAFPSIIKIILGIA